MKLPNLIGVGISVVFIAISFYYSDEVSFLRWSNNFNLERYVDSNYNGAIKLTKEAGYYSLIFIVSLTGLLFYNRITSNITKIRVYASLLIFISFGILAWNVLMIASPSNITFDEVGIVWMIYAGLCGLYFGFTFWYINKLLTPFSSDDILDGDFG